MDKDLRTVWKKFKSTHRVVFYMVDGLSFCLIVGEISYKKLAATFKKYVWDPREETQYPNFDPAKISLGAITKK